jgi:hypothetical protein
MIVPLQLVDNFLLQYNVGQVLALGYVLALLGSFAVASARVVALNTVIFGLLFVAAPSSLVPFHFKLLGLGLLVAAPLMYTLSSR